ncbi:hypothetical protein EU528_14405 [Candidatus Thorarchaeota archaeon]|nr:MAG: hypothetical protein EU528_14405 [Candidatus Thorarchaeota archaeon]
MAFEETPQISSINLRKTIVFSIIGGLIITLVTSILPNNTAIGASNSGYPFPFLSQPLYPIGSPPTIIWSAVIIDMSVWAVLAFVVIFVYQLLKSRSSS